MIEQASLERRQRVNDSALQAQKISIKSFFDERIRIEQGAIDLLIKTKERELETSKEKAVIEAELQILAEKRSDIEIKSIEDRTRAEEQLALKITDLRNQLLSAQGNTTQARLNELGLSFAQKVQELVANSDETGIQLAKKLFNIEAAKIQFEALENEFKQVMQTLRAEQQSLQAEVQIGSRTQLSATTELNTLRDDAKAKLQTLIDKMRELAEASNDPRLKTALVQMEQQVDGVKKRIDATTETINSQFATGFSNAITNFVSGTQSAKNAFRQFGSEFLKTIAQMIIKQTILNTLREQEKTSSGSSIGGIIAGAITSGVFHQGGIVGQTSTPRRTVSIQEFANAARYHQGGVIGGLKRDERAAILQTGEEVLARNDPRNVLNESDQSVRDQSEQNIAVYNLIDKTQLRDTVLSNADKHIVNIIGKNRSSIKDLLTYLIKCEEYKLGNIISFPEKRDDYAKATKWITSILLNEGLTEQMIDSVIEQFKPHYENLFANYEATLELPSELNFDKKQVDAITEAHNATVQGIFKSHQKQIKYACHAIIGILAREQIKSGS